MNREEIVDRVKKMIAEQFGMTIEEISEKSNLQNDLNADSLDAVEIIMEVEDAFNISIPDEEAEALFTIGSIINYVEKNLSKGE